MAYGSFLLTNRFSVCQVRIEPNPLPSKQIAQFVSVSAVRVAVAGRRIFANILKHLRGALFSAAETGERR